MTPTKFLKIVLQKKFAMHRPSLGKKYDSLLKEKMEQKWFSTSTKAIFVKQTTIQMS